MSRLPGGPRFSSSVIGTAALLFVTAVLVTTVGTAQQPSPASGTKDKKRPRVEEVEDPSPPKAKQSGRVEEKVDPSSKSKPKKPIVVDDDPDEPSASGGNGSGELAKTAAKLRNPTARKLLRDLSRPYDLMTFKQPAGSATPARQPKVRPIAQYVGAEPTKTVKGKIDVKYLDENVPFTIHLTVNGEEKYVNIVSVRHYEELVQDEVAHFLDSTKETADPEERLTAAEAALAFAVRFHGSARDTGEREDSPDWRRVEAGLRQRLLGVTIDRLRLRTDANDWDGAYDLTRRLVGSYTSDEDQAKIAVPLIEFVERAFKSGLNTSDDTRVAVRRLRNLEGLFQPGNPVIKPLSDSVTEQAKRLFAEAVRREGEAKGDTRMIDEAREFATQAAELRPDLPELRTFQTRVAQRHLILRVGVHELPRSMSPARAVTDSDRRAVELMFEGLLRFTVDRAGNGRFEPALSEGRPRVLSLGRYIHIPRNAYWSDNTPVTALDVQKTVDLLKQGKGTGRGAAWGDMLDNFQVPGDPTVVRAPLLQGYLDAGSLLTFKIVPGQKKSGRADPDDEKFATNPVGSGPYRYEPLTNSEAGFQCVSFVASPAYAARAGREGRPQIHEIRFFEYGYKPEDAGLAAGRDNAPVALLLDLTADQAARLRADGPKLVPRLEVPLPEASKRPNLRVYFLAVNQRNPSLANEQFRQALAHAVDREGLLDACFREHPKAGSPAALGKLHTALNGPYPARSWACNKGAGSPPGKVKDSLDLFDPGRAKALFDKLGDARPKVALRLLYPDRDPAVGEAMKLLAGQVQGTLGVQVDLEPLRPEELRRRVEGENSYDLAYYFYDFPDETYWLWPLLADKGTQDRANYLGLAVSKDQLTPLFTDVGGRREFIYVQKMTHAIHSELYRQMPVIPLWQLDPLFALPAPPALEAPGVDGHLTFTNVDRWRMQPLLPR